MRSDKYFILILLLIISIKGFGQSVANVDSVQKNHLNNFQSETAANNISNASPSFVTAITNFPDKLFNKVTRKTKNLEKQLDRQTEKYIRKLAKREGKLKKKLYQSDSVKANLLFANDPQQRYLSFLQKIKKDSAGNIHSMGPEYLPYADSLEGTLAFLNKNPTLLSSGNSATSLNTALNGLRRLESKLQDADLLKAFIKQRSFQVKQYISQCTNLPSGVSNIYSDYNKQLYYYSTQIRHYRQTLNDPDKMMKLALALMNKLPAFSQFMQKNSFLAGMFKIPANYSGAEAVNGLQTRDEVLAMIHQQISSGGPNASSAIQASLKKGQQDMNKLRNKLSAMGGGSGDIDMPDFKPVNQKTKTFLQRLELGTNLQTQRAAYYFPTTTDLGLSVGYKISDKNIIGLGASYKIGWGEDFEALHSC